MSQIAAFDPTGQAIRGEPPNGFSAMKSEDFMRIIFTELANQDPFQPNDSAALLDQLNSIRSIESDLDLMERLDSLVLENKLAGASSMIGKFVSGLADGNHVGGVVVSVLRRGEDVGLELHNGWIVPVESVDSIQDLSLLQGGNGSA